VRELWSGVKAQTQRQRHDAFVEEDEMKAVIADWNEDGGDCIGSVNDCEKIRTGLLRSVVVPIHTQYRGTKGAWRKYPSGEPVPAYIGDALDVAWYRTKWRKEKK